MSAYVCSDLHISTVAHSIVTGEHCHPGDCFDDLRFAILAEKFGYKVDGATAAILLANSLAVAKRYNDDSTNYGKITQKPRKGLPPLQTVNLISCP